MHLYWLSSFWDVCILPFFISSLTESQLIACRDLRHTAAQHPLARLLNFIPAAAAGSLAGFLYPVDPGVFYHIPADRPYPLSLGLEAAGAAVLIGTFFVKQSMFERALTGSGKIVLTDSKTYLTALSAAICWMSAVLSII